MISGINHINFAIAGLDRSLAFYRDILGCSEVYSWDDDSYLEVSGLWLCLSVDSSASGASDYTHFAFDVLPENFAALSARILESGAESRKENQSGGDSLYFCCPDGHRLEIHVGNLESRLGAINEKRKGRCGSVQ